ncbi:MAG: NAD(P)-binding domain-containing protein [Ktedonobacterales bacterium]|nr:NAD(P)-binding domain-containing protein [Ktedonobacterales bacterium]
MNTSTLPIAIIGGGPVGLAAAAQLLARGATPIIFEAGTEVGAAVAEWGHVRLFSPWRYLIDAAAADLLHAAGWRDPDPEALPTGQELVDQYLRPLAALPTIAPHLHLGARVVAVARQGYDKMKTPGREAAPFVLTIRGAAGATTQVLACAVIDASGTYAQPNPLGANGLPALGEAKLGVRVAYGIPDVLGTARARYAGKRVLVVGSGHSAFNALLDLARLAEQEPTTRIVWAVRRATLGTLFGGGDTDALPARGQLGQRLQRVIDAGVVERHTDSAIERVRLTKAGIVASTTHGDLPHVDELIVATGFRPDLELTRELRLDLDPSVESPRALAPLIDPNVHSCGTVPPHGYEELQHPEADFFIVGMKSYGRAPTFLMLTGYEQVRSIACALTGDLAGARQVQLVLPETGVCSTDGGGCCDPVVTVAPKWQGKAIPVLGATRG